MQFRQKACNVARGEAMPDVHVLLEHATRYIFITGASCLKDILTPQTVFFCFMPLFIFYYFTGRSVFIS